MRPMWMIECLDRDEAETLLTYAPEGSKIEEHGQLVILWVPVPEDVIERELGHSW